MGDRQKRRRLALALRAAGLSLIAFSVSGAALNCGLEPTLAAPLASVARTIVAGVTSAAAAPAPPVPAAAGPTPTPTPGPQVQRGGPVTFSLSGSLNVGDRLQSLTHSDGAGNSFATTDSTALGNAGMMASIQRRTASTTLQLSMPFGLALHSASLGQVAAGYYTPKFGIEYGAQPLSFLGGVPFGQTLRSYALVLPLHGGDLTLFRGPAFGAYTQTLDLIGARARMMMHGTLFEFGADHARSTDGSRADALILGAARSSGMVTQSVEGAFEGMHDGDGAQSRGFSYQYRADVGAGDLYTSFTTRRITDGFLAFGSGRLQSDAFADASLRYTKEGNSFEAGQSLENAGLGVEAVRSNRSSLNFTHLFGRSNVETAFSLWQQRRQSFSGIDWLGNLGAQVGFNFANVSTLLGAQFQRATLSYGAPQALVTYTSSLQRQFGSYSLSASYQNTRATGSEGGLQGMGTLSVSRNFGLAAIALNLAQVHNISAADDLVQTSPTITVSRRLSPAATLAVTYGEQRTRDLTNPANDGRNRIFSVQVAAPFAIGNGLVQGRADPRLPATISGSVTSDYSSSSQGQFNFASQLNSGLANVVVVLDGKDVQRTDLSGHYQFNFVTPGLHEVRLESSSLPRGVTVDQPYATVSVMGGQAAQVLFQVGTFGAIAGHIYGRDTSGSLVPLSNVGVKLDDAVVSISNPFGAYSFGRLTAGTHTISIVDTSLPASVAFAKPAETQKVNVRNGEVATVDFAASPLGSIAGFVTFNASAGAGHTGGVNNAYVVAEPGDYAAITNEDGSYLLDNLPAGTYTLDLDPETLPDGTGSASGPVTIVFTGESKDGVNFTVGQKLKPVVFSLKTTDVSEATMTLSEPVLPPRGSAEAVVDAAGSAKSVTATAFGKHVPFAYDRSRKRWIATMVVPVGTAAGKTTIVAEIADGKPHRTASAELTVDPSVPLVSVKLTPAHPNAGQYVTVRARILGDVHAGDTIRWLDGQLTKLASPISGRIFVFSVKISERPMRGMLLTRQGELPIMLR